MADVGHELNAIRFVVVSQRSHFAPSKYLRTLRVMRDNYRSRTKYRRKKKILQASKRENYWTRSNIFGIKIKTEAKMKIYLKWKIQILGKRKNAFKETRKEA